MDPHDTPRPATPDAKAAVDDAMSTLLGAAGPDGRVVIRRTDAGVRVDTTRRDGGAAVTSGDAELSAATVREWVRDRTDGEGLVARARGPAGTVLTLRKGPEIPGRPVAADLTVTAVSHVDETLSAAGFSAAHRAAFAGATSGGGLLVVSAPTKARADSARAFVLSLVRAAVVPPDELPGVSPDPKGPLLVVPVVADEPLEALTLLRELGVVPDWSSLRGSFSQVVLRRVCQACAKRTVIDRAAVAHLPPALLPPPDTVYRVGRGCPACGQTGYRGGVGVQSIVVADGSFCGLLASSAEHADLLRNAAARGYRPLLDDGVAKCLAGVTTFESLNEVVRPLSSPYAELYRRPPPPAAPDPGPPPKSVPTGRPTLLLVEDDEDQQQVLSLVFAGAYDVRVAKDGVEALDAVRASRPDVIVSDLMMPRMDGAELLARLKRDPGFRSIPVLMLTVVTDDEREYTLLDRGADDYCEKTVRRKVLLKRVERLLENARPG